MKDRLTMYVLLPVARRWCRWKYGRTGGAWFHRLNQPVPRVFWWLRRPSESKMFMFVSKGCELRVMVEHQKWNLSWKTED